MNSDMSAGFMLEGLDGFALGLDDKVAQGAAEAGPGDGLGWLGGRGRS